MKTTEKAFFKCAICGNLVGLVADGGAPMECCGQPMDKLTANTQDASLEKHVPVAEIKDDLLTVKIGAATHPMVPEHYIQWILVTQGNRTQRVELIANDEPTAEFCAEADGEVIVYAYCNLHGLWKTTL